MSTRSAAEKPTRKLVSADVRRGLLLDAALRVMKRDGIAGATTRAICAEAGMPHGAFHYCFDSKTDLYKALLARGIDIGLDDAWPDVTPDASSTENIRMLLHAYWSAIESDPDGQLVLFDLGSLALREPELHDLSTWEYQASLEKILDHLTRLEHEAGITYLRDTAVVAEMVSTILNGVAWSWLSHRNNALARTTLNEHATLLATLTAPASEQSK